MVKTHIFKAGSGLSIDKRVIKIPSEACLGVGELYRFTRSGAYFGTFWKPERFCLMNFTAI